MWPPFREVPAMHDETALVKVDFTIGADHFSGEGPAHSEVLPRIVLAWLAAISPSAQREVDALTARLRGSTDDLASALTPPSQGGSPAEEG